MQAVVLRLSLRAYRPTMSPPTDEPNNIMGRPMTMQIAPSMRKRKARAQTRLVGSHGPRNQNHTFFFKDSDAPLTVTSPITSGPPKRNALVMTQIPEFVQWLSKDRRRVSPYTTAITMPMRVELRR